MKTFTIQGNHLSNGDDFYNQIEILFLKSSDIYFGRNLDALSDILFGGFGSFDENEEIELIWTDFEMSKKYIPEIDIIEEIIGEHKHIHFKKA